MNKPTKLIEWQALQKHQQAIVNQRMSDWFAKDSERFSRFSIIEGELLLDYSKNHITSETLPLLCQLAEKCQLKTKIDALFAGEPVNITEKRPVLHTALRNKGQALYVNKHNILQDVRETLAKMKNFTDQVRHQTWLGCTGKPISTIVNIGIGGSDLGPMMAVHALKEYTTDQLRCYFISNVDSAHLNEVLAQIDPETTLFIVSSKSFTTLETLTNAQTIREWLINKLNTTEISQHFVAVTASPKKAEQFGIPEQQIFLLWDWVGGRYSVWSAMGLPLMLMIGAEQFSEFLQGAYEMDQHFQTAPFSENMPVIMALLGIWYINFFSAISQAVIPYSHALNYFHTYLQQADMESNGKSITVDGTNVNYVTGPILWGEQGCNGQHAFYQSLHQGQHFIPVDFILVAESDGKFTHQHDLLVASGLSQSQALMQGKSADEVLAELLSAGCSKAEAEHLVPHRIIPGNHPNNVLFIKKITPHHLGALIALYEHKIFVQGAIWNINSFDQWGVELGKQLLPDILIDLKNESPASMLDASTMGLIHHYRKIKEQA